MYYEIKTDRLILRPLNINDLDSVHIYASDKDNTTFMLKLPNDAKEETAQFLTKVTNEWGKENPSFYEFAITLNEEQVGAISIALKLTANCDYRNSNSYRLMERIGLQLESNTGIRTYPKTSETAKELIYSLLINQT